MEKQVTGFRHLSGWGRHGAHRYLGEGSKVGSGRRERWQVGVRPLDSSLPALLQQCGGFIKDNPSKIRFEIRKIVTNV